jgi:uncharacterized protein (DUF305 family)
MSSVSTMTFCRSSLLVSLLAALLALQLAVSAEEPAPRRNQARFEVKFMQNMIDHHHMAVMMAELCESRAIHEELLTLCEQIAHSQSAEIEEMQGWLHDWYGVAYEPRMTRQMERQLASLARLRGARFEIAFMEMMIEHHEVAIKEGRACLRKAHHEDLIEMCENIISTQSMEIMLMEMWLCDWYDRCD